MTLALRIDDMGRQRLDIIFQAAFRTGNIAVAHQGQTIALNADDAVYYIARTFHPGQYNITNLQGRWMLQNHTFPPSNNKRKHASTPDGERYAQPLVD